MENDRLEQGLARMGQVEGVNAQAVFSGHLLVAIDMFVADAIRDHRSGKADLRAAGLTETADLLGL